MLTGGKEPVVALMLTPCSIFKSTMVAARAPDEPTSYQAQEGQLFSIERYEEICLYARVERSRENRNYR
jgi:hypothetical protein